MISGRFPSLLFLFYGITEAILETEVLCDVDLTKFIDFSYDPNCLQIVVKNVVESSCIRHLQRSNTVSVKILTFGGLKQRDISSELQEKCEIFLIIARNVDDLKEVFDLDRGDDKQQFFPFTKIYIYRIDNGSTFADDYMTELKNYLHENALFGSVFEPIKEKMFVRDLLRRRSILSYKPINLFHPFVDTSLTKYNFTVSLFSCRPFIFYPENASDDM